MSCPIRDSPPALVCGGGKPLIVNKWENEHEIRGLGGCGLDSSGSE
jgi:hypothetical protein